MTEPSRIFNDLAALRRSIEQHGDDIERLKFADGGGTSDGMDGWRQSVETRLAQLHSDVRQVLYAVLAVAVAGILIFWTGYTRLDDKLSQQRDAISSDNAKVDGINAKLDTMMARQTAESAKK